MKTFALFAVLNLLAVFSTAAAPVFPPDKARFQLFLLAGQSNMAGRGAVTDLTAAEKAPDSRVLALNASGEWQPALDPVHWDKPGAAGVGPGKFFGKIIADKNPGVVVGLIPTACGGSPIATWQPGATNPQTKSKPYDDCIARARRALKDGTLKAILWHQGEGDANPASSAVYEEKLVGVINRLRADLGAPEIPFIMGQLGRFPGRTWDADRIAVDRAQRAVAAKMKNVYFVSAEGLLSRGDNLHFNTASQKIFAERYAAAYIATPAKK